MKCSVIAGKAEPVTKEAQTMESDVLAANQAFYRAFASGDIAAMDAVWAKGEGVACAHPGWSLLIGRDAVLESWKAILSSGPPAIVCRAPLVLPAGDVKAVLCYEELERSVMLATNLFRRQEGGWKLYHHHAGPCQEAPFAPSSETQSPLQ